MTLRMAEARDIDALADLLAQAFPGRPAAERKRQLETGAVFRGLDDTWLAERDGRIVGAFRTCRLTQYIETGPMPCTGLASVAVASWARRTGLGHRLCAEAIRIGRDRGDLINVLYPFRPEFYHTMGWGSVGRLLSYRFRPEALPAYEEGGLVIPAGQAEHRVISECYARVASASNGPIRRDDRLWARHLEAPGNLSFAVPSEAGVRGYLITGWGPARAPAERVLRLRELVAEDDEAYRALLGWVSLQRDQWRRALHDARPDEGFGDRLRDPRPPGFRPRRRLWFPTATLLQGPMLRVLDVPAALRARGRWGVQPHESLVIEIEVVDQEVPENRGPWRLVLADGGSTVEPAGGRPSDASLATDAASFARILVGELLPTSAQQLGLARLQGQAEAIDRAFRANRAFWLPDVF